MTEHSEQQFAEMRVEVRQIGIAVAKIEAMLTDTRDDVKEARAERQKIMSELGAYGIQLSNFVNKIDSLQTIASKLEPAVASLQSDRLMIAGAGKFAMGVSRILWIVGGLIVSIIASFATYFGLIKPHDGQ